MITESFKASRIIIVATTIIASIYVFFTEPSIFFPLVFFSLFMISLVNLAESIHVNKRATIVFFFNILMAIFAMIGFFMSVRIPGMNMTF